ncbi:hypothetical protein GCM10022287_31210 [Gryllotalpicola koreensis]|uniref:Uncharacterized protein n=1 Tax=Gryllotalpicola koreensis TaxID=993086 RepID=A0ABP8A754_9MICO
MRERPAEHRRHAPLARLDEPLIAQLRECLPHRPAARAELRAELRFGGQRRADGQVSRSDALADRVSDDDV